MAEEIIPVEVSGQRQKPVSLLEAVSEIQRYYVAESGGSGIPADYFTIDMQMEYMWIGTRSVLHGGIFTIIFMPILIGVLQDKIHVFGHETVTVTDRIYMLCITLMFAMGYAFFYAYISKFNAGEVTKRMLLNMYSGVTIGSIIKAVVSILIYHLCYFAVFTEGNVYWVLSKLKFISAAVRTDIFYWIKDTKDVFITSVLWVFFTSVAYIMVCWICYITSENRKKSQEKSYGKR